MQTAARAREVLRAALAQVVMAAAYISFAVTLFPTLRQHDAGLATGFLAFRTIAGVFVLFGAIPLLVILKLSREFLGAGTPERARLHALGALLRRWRDLLNHVAMIFALSAGGLLLYSLLLQSGLVPAWLAVWGLLGTVLAIVASALVWFRLLDVRTRTYVTLNLPLAAQEVVLAFWLIARGLNTAVIEGA